MSEQRWRLYAVRTPSSLAVSAGFIIARPQPRCENSVGAEVVRGDKTFRTSFRASKTLSGQRRLVRHGQALDAPSRQRDIGTRRKDILVPRGVGPLSSMDT